MMKRIKDVVEWQFVDFRYDEGIRGRTDSNLCPTITTKASGYSGMPLIMKLSGGGSMLKIRKLTPKETTRLMGFQDCDHDAMRSIGLSDNAVWHICGDSIVVPVLIGIFSQLFEEDKHIEIINNYIDTIKKEGE